MGTLRRLSGSPLPAHSQSAAPGIRPGPHRTVSLRIQVSNAHHHATSCVCLHSTHHTLWLARLGLLETTRPKNIYNNSQSMHLHVRASSPNLFLSVWSATCVGIQKAKKIPCCLPNLLLASRHFWSVLKFFAFTQRPPLCMPDCCHKPFASSFAKQPYCYFAISFAKQPYCCRLLPPTPNPPLPTPSARILPQALLDLLSRCPMIP